MNTKIFVWLTLQDSILTKDNLIKRKWKGSPACALCQDTESINHLMFHCLVVKYVWSILAYSFGLVVRPCSFTQYWTWINMCLPGGKQVYFVGLAAICWSIWRSQNNICFEKKRIKITIEVVCLICANLAYSYWACLQKGATADQMEQGAEIIKMVLHFHHHAERGKIN